MNHANIAAVRRLISQFNGHVVVTLGKPIDGAVPLGNPKRRWQDCAVGEWVEYLPGITDSRRGIVKLPVPVIHDAAYLMSIADGADVDHRLSNTVDFEFEPFPCWPFWCAGHRTGWRRVA